MGMKSSVYVAAPFEHRTVAETVAKELRAAGCKVVSTWHDPDSNEKGYEDYEDGEGAERDKAFTYYAQRDIIELDQADELVYISLPGGKGGKDFEMGYAFASGMEVIVLGPPTHVFHYLEEVHRFLDLEAFLSS